VSLFFTDIKSYRKIHVIHEPRRINRSLPKETSEIFAAGEVTFNAEIAHRDDHWIKHLINRRLNLIVIALSLTINVRSSCS